MVNKVILIGRVTADPEVRTTGSGTAVANIRIATNSFTGKDSDGVRKEHTEFHSLVVFGRQAEVAGEYLKKGKLLYADGRLQTHSWEDSEGRKRYSTEVVVDSFQLLSPRSEGEAAAA
ncbi:MAG TPA: single-stranded DNA-binding protein [Candidatus Dormibacteraeota bacterium]